MNRRLQLSIAPADLAAPSAMPGLLPGWYILCRSRQLRQRPLPVRIGERRLVAFRTAAGALGLLDDRCAHRGMPLSCGKVQGERLRCPYHGWAYAADGRVAEVPAMVACPSAWDGLAVGALAIAESDGFVWGRVGDAELKPPHRFLHLGEPGWTSFAMQTAFDASIEACLENFLDCPHAAFVHRHWFRAPTSKTVHCIVRTLTDGAEAEYHDEPREKSAVWTLLAPRRGRMRHTDRFIAPHTSQVDYAFDNGMRYQITSVCSPLASDRTMVHTVISFRVGRLGWLVRLFFEPLSRIIIKQDVRTLARCQHNPAAAHARGFANTAADLLGPHIRAWRQALGRGTPTPASGQETHVDITL